MQSRYIYLSTAADFNQNVTFQDLSTHYSTITSNEPRKKLNARLRYNAASTCDKYLRLHTRYMHVQLAWSMMERVYNVVNCKPTHPWTRWNIHGSVLLVESPPRTIFTCSLESRGVPFCTVGMQLSRKSFNMNQLVNQTSLFSSE